MKLHLGCGERNFGPDWVHIDGADFPHLHSYNITKLPFDDNTADLIYASHVIEYFDREEVRWVLLEWKRVLKQGGKLRLAVPDFNALINLHLYRLPLSSLLGPLYGKMKMNDEYIYHKTVYNYDSLKILLQDSGYVHIKQWDWRETEHAMFDDHSQAYYPHMDKENGTLISLNVECEKA